MNDAGNNYLKERNLKILKRILFEKKTATKTELSNISTLSTVTVNSLVKVLVETGEFIEGELIQQKMGRPAVIYSFNYNFQKYLLLSIQEEKNKLYINTVITNMAGEIKGEKLHSFDNIELAAIISIIDEETEKNKKICQLFSELTFDTGNGIGNWHVCRRKQSQSEGRNSICRIPGSFRKQRSRGAGIQRDLCIRL